MMQFVMGFIIGVGWMWLMFRNLRGLRLSTEAKRVIFTAPNGTIYHWSCERDAWINPDTGKTYQEELEK